MKVKWTDKYMYLARELKRQLKIEISGMPIAVGALGMVSKGLKERKKELEIRRRIETIHTIFKIDSYSEES